MSLLLDQLPGGVDIDGTNYPIRTDFRTSIRFELVMQGRDSDEDKLRQALELYYPEIPPDTAAAVDRLLWFYRCGVDDPVRQSRQTKRAYSFEHDAGYFYTAFLQAYNIDLQTTAPHWWVFRALLQALPECCEITKIMGYRVMTIDRDLPRKTQRQYLKLKEQYLLPDNRTEEEKETDFADDLACAF